MRKKKLLTGLIGLFLPVAILLTASTVYRQILARGARSSAMSAETLTDSTQHDAEAPQALLLELRPSGFIPAETTVPAGNYFLLLQNHSGLRELTFNLERQNEGTVASSNRDKRDWRERIQLTPGTYIVSETSHVEWRSVIRVTTH